MLGIETSCDDTAAAVVAGDGRVLGEAIAHQHEVHRPWGGVVPSLAREAHLAAIDAGDGHSTHAWAPTAPGALRIAQHSLPAPAVVDRALAQAGVGPQELSAVAVTVGPGLSLCLSVGLRKARQLSAAHRLPLVPLHHMEAHALVARMPGIAEGPPVSFPFVCLVRRRGLGDTRCENFTLRWVCVPSAPPPLFPAARVGGPQPAIAGAWRGAVHSAGVDDG